MAALCPVECCDDLPPPQLFVNRNSETSVILLTNAQGIEWSFAVRGPDFERVGAQPSNQMEKIAERETYNNG